MEHWSVEKKDIKPLAIIPTLQYSNAPNFIYWIGGILGLGLQINACEFGPADLYLSDSVIRVQCSLRRQKFLPLEERIARLQGSPRPPGFSKSGEDRRLAEGKAFWDRLSGN